MKANFMPILILLLVVVAAWIGFSIYFSSSELDIDPNATSYMKHINPTFSSEGLTEYEERMVDNVLVSPDLFLNLVREN